MEPRLLAMAISSLISQALLILLLIPLPPITPPNLIPLLISTSNITTTLLSRKRKHQQTLTLTLNPDPFTLPFNMTASTFNFLSGLLEPLLDCRDPLPLPLPAPARLALALSRFATGASYQNLARQFGVPVPSAQFITKHFCRVLCTNFRFWLAFPAAMDLDAVSLAFRSLSGGLAGCCGAVACTRFGSLAAQVVTDSSARIIGIAAGFNGELTEAEVLTRTSLYKDVESGLLLGDSQYLVGSSGYPLLPWLMVPFAEPVPGSSEEDFNAVHVLMCRPALRAVSSLRNWGVLNCLLEEEDAKVAVACIGTCAILHNVLLMREDYSALSDATIDYSASSDQCMKGVGLEEGAPEKKALMVRSTLAVRARAIRESVAGR